MIIKKAKEHYSAKDIGICVEESTTLEELEYLYENIKKDFSMNEKDKNLLLTMIPFKMASIGFKTKTVSK